MIICGAVIYLIFHGLMVRIAIEVTGDILNGGSDNKVQEKSKPVHPARQMYNLMTELLSILAIFLILILLPYVPIVIFGGIRVYRWYRKELETYNEFRGLSNEVAE